MKQKLLILVGCLAIVSPMFAQSEVQALREEIEALRKRVEALESNRATPYNGLTGKELDRYDLSTSEAIIHSLQEMEERFDLPALYLLYKRFATSQLEMEDPSLRLENSAADFVRLFTSHAPAKVFRSITVTESGDISNNGLTISLVSYQTDGKDVHLVVGFRRYPPFPYLVPDMKFEQMYLSGCPYNTVDPANRTKQDIAVEKALGEWMGKTPDEAAKEGRAALDEMISKSYPRSQHNLRVPAQPSPDEQTEADRNTSKPDKGNKTGKH